MTTVPRLRWIRAFLAGLCLAGSFAMFNPAAAIRGETVVLGGLDKITARVSKFEATIDQPVRFGALEIVVRSCDRTPPEEPPESAAFLEIREIKADEQLEIRLFSGWMFASSPALSALEHPIYDIWVLECRTPSTSESSSSE